MTFAILTNRKRAIIALAHSFVFLGIAIAALVRGRVLNPIWTQPSPSSFLILAIYGIVASVLIQLARISRCSQERLYFVFCATSASVGLLRTVFGDPIPVAGPLLRTVLLVCAVATGMTILREYQTTWSVVPPAVRDRASHSAWLADD